MSSDTVFFCRRCDSGFPEVSDGVCPMCGSALQHGPATVYAETYVARDATFSDDPRRSIGKSTGGANGKRTEPELAAELLGQSFGNYQVERLLGRGAMGEVYLARHRSLHRPCAVKFLSPRVVDEDVDYARRFLHEGRAAAGLIHPNIVTVHAIGEKDGRHYLEMEFVAGESLQSLLNREGRFAPLRATSLAAEIAQGLAVAHRDGIVHRDLKADNVLLTHRGVPKIADFGLAKRLRDDDGLPQGRAVGTPHYMAPELFRGDEATTSSDVYALGVVFYQMLAGRFPFEGDSLAKLRNQVEVDPPPSVREAVPEISLEMASCLSGMLEKSPANRPSDALEALHLLQGVLGEVQDIESLLTEALEDLPTAHWVREEGRYRVHLEFSDGRTQQVYLESSSHPPHQRLLSIYSLCCPAQGDYYEQALKLNAEIPHGGLAIRDENETPYFVMIDTYPRSTLVADTIRRSVLEVGARADWVENLLTGMDVH